MKHKLWTFVSKKIKKDKKALRSIYQSILGIISDLEINEDEILKWIEDAENDIIFNSLDFIRGGNWCDSIKNKKYINFMKELFQCRPIGLGTPNAACGEGELMLILSSTKISKPTKNDIQIDDVKYNLKNDLPRIFATNTGAKINKKLLQVCSDLGFNPNDHKSIKSVQLVNKNFIENHWNPQFKKYNISKLEKLLYNFLLELFPDKSLNIDEIENIVKNSINNNQLVWDKWIEELMVFLYKNGEEKTENLVLMNVDGEVKIIPNNLDMAIHLIRNKKIKFNTDYFRMSQDKKVGIYISVVN